MQSCWWSHWSHPQPVLGGEEESICEKRLGYTWHRSVQISSFSHHTILVSLIVMKLLPQALLCGDLFNHSFQGCYVELKLWRKRRKKWCTSLQKMQVCVTARYKFFMQDGLSHFCWIKLWVNWRQFWTALNRIWPLWAANLWRSSQDAAISEENSGSDRSPGSREAKSEEQTYLHEPSPIWNHCTLWVCDTDSWCHCQMQFVVKWGGLTKLITAY